MDGLIWISLGKSPKEKQFSQEPKPGRMARGSPFFISFFGGREVQRLLFKEIFLSELFWGVTYLLLLGES